jgi:NAD(P)-dependent dehydrogenase (short-subunit alcohol dehydrogenase family)
MIMQNYNPSPGLLKDRIILVTGAGDGIGRTAARNFAAFGATVVLLGRTLKKLEKVYDEIEQAGCPQPAIYPMNLEGASPKDYADLAQTLQKEFGHLHGLLHNAAILGTLTPIIHYNIERWYQVLQVNLNAPFLLTHAVLDLMQRSNDASITFTLDSVSDRGQAYWGAYGVSKGATQTLMKILANELESKGTVRVNGVDPGKVRSQFRLQAYPAGDSNSWASPADIMNIYLYLMGPDSKGITGQIFKAQG